MTRMARTFALLALATLGASALAQDSSTKMGARLKIGYFYSGEFELRAGGDGRLDGPEVSLDIPFSKGRGFDLFITPSIGFGGQLMHGADVDGTTYRFMLTARKTINSSGMTASLSAGFGHTVSRGTNAFVDSHGFVGQFALGLPLRGLRFIEKFASPGWEVAFSLSDQPQLRGVSIGLTFGF